MSVVAFPARFKLENFYCSRKQNLMKKSVPRADFFHKEGLMREENYLSASWGIFYDAFGRKKQVSHLRKGFFLHKIARAITSVTLFQVKYLSSIVK